MWSELLVFVSSTSDLSREREAIVRGLPPGFKAYLYERDRTGSYSPEQRLEHVLENCEAAAFVLGSRYGSPYPGSTPAISIVEWEFETARRLGNAEIFTYLKRVEEQEAEERQRHFRQRISGFRKGVWVKDFETEDDLLASLKDDLLTWLADFRREVTRAGLQDGLVASQHKLLLGTAVAASLTLVAGFAIKATLDLPMTTFIGFSLVSIVAILGCIILTHLFLRESEDES